MFGKNKKGKQHGHIDTLIGTKTHVEGNINFSGGLRVDGHICGNITAISDTQSTLVLVTREVSMAKYRSPMLSSTEPLPVQSRQMNIWNYKQKPRFLVTFTMVQWKFNWALLLKES